MARSASRRRVGVVVPAVLLAAATLSGFLLVAVMASASVGARQPRASVRHASGITKVPGSTPRGAARSGVLLRRLPRASAPGVSQAQLVVLRLTSLPGRKALIYLSEKARSRVGASLPLVSAARRIASLSLNSHRNALRLKAGASGSAVPV